MVKVKMVAGKTYSCPSVFGQDDIVSRGDTREVTEEQAKLLLADSFLDALNNEHFYFAEADAPPPRTSRRPVAPDPDEEEEPAAQAPAPRVRKQPAAK